MNFKKASALIAGAGAGFVLGKKLKEKDFCPVCMAKKALASTQVHVAKI